MDNCMDDYDDGCDDNDDDQIFLLKFGLMTRLDCSFLVIGLDLGMIGSLN